MADVIAAASFGDSFVDWLWICVGVVISVLLPVLSAAVRSMFGATAAIVDFKKYAVLAAFSALTALLVLAVYRGTKPDEDITFYAALLAGYGWEATVEKLVGAP